MDDVAWGALTLALTLLGGMYTWWAYQHRGLAPALRGASLTCLPVAAYLTDTLRMFTRVVDAVGDWATGLVFSPAVWLGVVVAGMAVLLLGASRVVDRRTGGRSRAARATKEPGAAEGGRARGGKALGRPKGGEPVVSTDDDMAEIEALLRKRGIT